MSDKSILALSDEELLALGPDGYEKYNSESPETEVEETEEEEQGQEQQETQEVEETEEEEESSEEETQETEEQEQEETEETEEQETEQKPQEKPVKTEKGEKKPAPKKEPDKVEQTSAVNAEAELAKLFAPFKASGREIKIDSVDEAITLMQKGLNYTDKMAALKPSINIMRTLEKEGIDANTLNYLIDIHKKKPEAIAKLVKDSGVDPLEVDENKVNGYKPSKHELSEVETALEDVVADLKQGQHYDRVIEFASQRVDQASRNLIVENPHVLKLFEDHMASGHFDIIQAELAKQKALGKLQGMNDLQAYDAVGNSLAARGAFNHLGQAKQQEQAPAVIKPEVAKKTDPTKVAAKKAAAPVKQTQGSGKKPDFNPLSMSDEEFAAQMSKKAY